MAVTGGPAGMYYRSGDAGPYARVDADSADLPAQVRAGEDLPAARLTAEEYIGRSLP